MGMTLEETSKRYGIPLEHLRAMKKDGLIGDIIENNEVPWFTILREVWGKPKYVRMQYLALNRHQQKEIVTGEKPLTQMERYVINRFTLAEFRETISVDTLAIELREKFGVRITDSLRTKIINLRNVARNQKKKSKYGSMKKQV